MAKENFKNKLDGNELDLSLIGLDEIPVKEIAPLVKATHIDLSCNRILNIPSSFCGLKQIVKLDLSKNVIESLPFNFGDLSKLQYLDLDSNRITMLPISFGNLKSLRWLDLKNNPLDPQLQAIAGDCIEAKQCQSCARKVVNFMQKVDEQFQLEEEQNRKQIQEVKENLKVETLKREEQPVNKKITNGKKTSGQQTQTEKPKKVPQVVQPRSKAVLTETQQSQQNGKRKTNEKTKQTNEKTKQTNEKTKQTNEKTKQTNEKTKQTNEKTKQTNEKTKQMIKTNEKTKQTIKSSSNPPQKKSRSKNGKKSSCWGFFSLLLAATFLLASTLAAVLCFYTGGDISSEAIQKAIPNITDDAAKLMDVAQMKLNDCIEWMNTDGRKKVSWATENVLILLGQFIEISIYSFNHVREKLEYWFEILNKWIESSYTVTMTTPNAKPM